MRTHADFVHVTRVTHAFSVELSAGLYRTSQLATYIANNIIIIS